MIFLDLWKLTILHMKRKFDIVHIHNMPDILVVAGLISKWLGAALVLDVHDPMVELFQVNYNVKEAGFMIRILKIQERISYKFANCLITVSHQMSENIAQKIGCNKDDITVVQNLPDLDIFPIKNNVTRWPRNKNQFVVLYSGTVTEHYCLDIAVKAIAIVSKKIPNILLRILGEGNRLQHVLDLAKKLSISDRVKHINLSCRKQSKILWHSGSRCLCVI